MSFSRDARLPSRGDLDPGLVYRVPESFLAEQKAAIWSEIPAWAPGDALMT
ncbi:MAG: hypothetical protein IPN47_16125 [Gemmatimonadetes bacterium]|nr:hypothetical protein [Gemmatimonadota bacterium]